MKICLKDCCCLLFVWAYFSLLSSSHAARPSKEETLLIVERLHVALAAEATEPDLMFWPGFLDKFPDLKHLTDNAQYYRPAAAELFLEHAQPDVDFREFTNFISTSGILIAAMYGLPPEEYLGFTEDILTAVEEGRGKINVWDLSSLIFPKLKNTRLFSANFKHSRVRKILERAKGVWSSHSPTQRARAAYFPETIDSILSGENYRSIARHRWRYPHEYPNNLKLPVLRSQTTGQLSRQALYAVVCMFIAVIVFVWWRRARPRSGV